MNDCPNFSTDFLISASLETDYKLTSVTLLPNEISNALHTVFTKIANVAILFIFFILKP